MSQSQSLPQQQAILPEYLHPSPISLDEPIKHEQATQSKSYEYTQRERDSSSSSEHEVDGLGQVNEHTEGAEFYGPTGTFYFLARLRSRANTQKQPEVGTHRKQSSIVNLLHSSDYSTPPDSRVLGQNPYGKGSPQSTVAKRESYQQGINTDIVLSAADALLATDIERECARLYFHNLHNIHPILEQMTFLKRCEEEIWSRTSRPDILMFSQMRREARFLALYNVVIAIGAITAGETSMLMEDHTREFLDRTGQSGEDDSLYPPIRLARIFFERSRLHLEDICESSSLETAQTLFLMHFPNSAYCLINPMVDLAKILMWMTDNMSLHSNHTSLQRLSQTALNLDRELDDWKSGLPRQLRFDTSSLEDSEFAMKQKTVLKLQEVMENIELSLDIFKAMKMLAVARRCADIVKELLHVAAKTHSGQQRQNSVTTETEPAMRAIDGGSQLTYTSPAFTSEGTTAYAGDTEFGDAMIPGDFDANLVDPNVVWNFLNFEHWNAWSDAAFK
ncbi:C6 transcription factor [Colletotrichum tofieldiae]|nr:C6 transcription factor [Colletotrichum tofieldiae]